MLFPHIFPWLASSHDSDVYFLVWPSLITWGFRFIIYCGESWSASTVESLSVLMILPVGMFLSTRKCNQWFQCVILWTGEVVVGSQWTRDPQNTSSIVNQIIFQNSGQKFPGKILFIMKSVSHFRYAVFLFHHIC
jgi:hypothetical protein